MSEAESIGARIDSWAKMESPEFWNEADVLDEIIEEADSAGDITEHEKSKFLARMRDVLKAYDHAHRVD